MVGMKKVAVGAVCLLMGVAAMAAHKRHGIHILNDTPHQHRWQLQNVSCNDSIARSRANKAADCESGTLGPSNSLAWSTLRVPLPSQACSYQVLIDGKMYCKGLCLDESQPVIIKNGKLSGFDVQCPKPSHRVR